MFWRGAAESSSYDPPTLPGHRALSTRQDGTQAEPVGIPPWDLSIWAYENKLALRRGREEESDDAGNLDSNVMEKIWESQADIQKETGP